MTKIVMVLLLLISSLGASASSDEHHYFGDRERGWFWYHDPAVVEEVPPAAEQPAATPASEVDPQALLKVYQKHLEDAKALAVMRPTDENVRRYLEVQQEAYGRSAQFADTWRRVVWSTPELDYSIQHPVNSPGLALDREQARARQVAAVSALGQTEGLFFFFSSSCGHCHTQAPILEQFGRRYGLKILAISLDGGTLPDFPGAVPDNGLAARLGVEVTPAVFMVNPRSREILPVGYGVMTESELLQRIYTLTAPSRGQF